MPALHRKAQMTDANTLTPSDDGFMAAVHDGDMAGGPFQKIVKRFPVDVKPGGGDQVVEVGIVFHHAVTVFQELVNAFPAEIRSGL